MKASDLFIKALEHEGVEYIFGLPGEENLDLLESIRKSNIKFLVARHEQCAGFMAATYGRLTGKTGVCLTTLGPGATNLVTAAAYAQLAAMPMLMITGQKPIHSLEIEEFLDNTWRDTGKAIFNNWLGLVYQLTNLDRKQQFMPGVDPDNPLGLNSSGD